MSDFEDGEEVWVGIDDNDDEKVIFSPDDTDQFYDFSVFNLIIDICNNYFPMCNVQMKDSIISFKIPRCLIFSPLLQIVCGFYHDDTVVEISLVFQKPSWTEKLNSFSITNPVFKQNFVGRPLINDVIINFFSSSFKPKAKYQLIECMLNSMFSNWFSTPKQVNTFPLLYDDCPLIYLIFEIVEAFLDIQDHCCICRTGLPFSVIKPSVCDSKLCSFRFDEIGIGTSVAQEIKRDPLAADLLISIFASCTDERYMNPKPHESLMRNSAVIFDNLPSMTEILNTCNNDTDICKKYGHDTLELLRWIILSNKSQIISLPPQLRINEVSSPFQFMTLIATLSAEKQFISRKTTNGSIFMWHGSDGGRWHSIIRNGLWNMSKTDCVNGDAYGQGIYLANNSSISHGYSLSTTNLYNKSQLGTQLSLIALCEVACVKELINHGQICTLTDEKACIVRFIFCSYGLNPVDLTNMQNIPTMEDIVKFL
ncbi:UBA/TS-N domain containing protein [Tritrichomonas foetus]|uniref:UBA/TS-N domain containing protein n=1 Tax=Tritrichomonas foetus TaxID=1144522 RepID=A0A1J4JY84_9EUKA|nr:UBA/TS-N domain containing protein [Tritrichomonas foetus]|eukprot:OHT03424.1 UBA/TS-N domain containing protein [Tritrichomonas foetus]